MPDPRTQAAQAAMSNAFSRAVDLSSLAQRPAPAGAASRQGAGGAGDGAASDGANPAYVIDATDASFEQVLQASNRLPIVVDLWASWCEPCKQLGPVLEKLAAEGNGTWILARVDVDANPGISQAFQVQSIPTVVALAGGRPVTAFSGAQPEAQVRDWIKQLIDQLREILPGIKEAEAALPPAEPEPEDPRLIAAREANDSGDHEAAARIYRQVIETEPGNAEAVAGLAWAEFFDRAARASADATAVADANPGDVPAACSAADVEVAAGYAPAGFARLVRAISLNSDDDRAAAREHLLALFALFSADDPDVTQARRALATALY